MTSSAAEDPAAQFVAYCHKRRYAALTIAALLCMLMLIAGALMTPRYRAEASLAVMPAPEFTVREDAGSHQFSSTALAMDQIMKAETEILGSADLRADAVASLAGPAALYPDLGPATRHGWLAAAARAVLHALFSPWRTAPPEGADLVQDAALHRFAEDLRVLPAKDSNVIAVTFTHRNPAMAARALDALLARYAERRRMLYKDPQLPVAQKEADGLAVTAAAAEDALARFKASHGVSDYNAERDLLLKRRSAAAQALDDAQAAHAQAQARLRGLTAAIHAIPEMATLYREDDPDTRLQAADAALVTLRGRLATARDQYRDSSTLVTGLAAEIRQAERQRRNLAANPAPSVLRRGRAPALDPLLVDQARAQGDMAAAAAQMEAISDSVQAIDARLHMLDAIETSLSVLTRRRDAAVENYASAAHVVAEQHMTEAEDSLRLANVRVIQKARMPVRPTPARLLVSLSGFLLGPMFALAWLYIGFVVRRMSWRPELPMLDAFSGADGTRVEPGLVG